MTKPILIFGYGNLSRGDDALGPLLLEALEQKIDLSDIEILNDFQLQIEHALDLENRELVLFIDASVSCNTAFNFSKLEALRDKSYSTHAMSPSAVLQVYQSIKKQAPPASYLLSIQGLSFELGEKPTEQANNNLQLATQFAEDLLKNKNIKFWNQQLQYDFI